MSIFGADWDIDRIAAVAFLSMVATGYVKMFLYARQAAIPDEERLPGDW